MAIDIFRPRAGALQHRSGQPRLQVPSAWRELLASDAVWLQTQPGQRQIGQRFEGELGQAVGGIVVTLDATAAAPTLAQWYAWGHEALQWLLRLGAGARGGLGRCGWVCADWRSLMPA